MPLHFDIKEYRANSHGKIKCYRSTFASRRHARAMAACLPCQDHVYITTDELLRFHKNEFDEMPCKRDSTENPRSFEKHPTPPQAPIWFQWWSWAFATLKRKENNKSNVGCMYVHQRGFVANQLGKTACNGIFFFLITSFISNQWSWSRSLFKSPHTWPLSDSNNGRAVGRPWLDWTQEGYGFDGR